MSCTAVTTNSSDKRNGVMDRAAIAGELAPSCGVDVQASPPPRLKSGKRARWRELELKVAALQDDYADLRAALFEASLVHRRLCAPRLIRHGEFEIASEIFAARHVPGDVSTAKETSVGVVLARGGIYG